MAFISAASRPIVYSRNSTGKPRGTAVCLVGVRGGSFLVNTLGLGITKRDAACLVSTRHPRNHHATRTPLRMLLDLSPANVNAVLADARNELGTLFGSSEENRKIGITGNVELVDIDGVTVVLRLTGRFWHKRSDVLMRVANFLTQQIPEIVDVEIEDPAQLDDADK